MGRKRFLRLIASLAVCVLGLSAPALASQREPEEGLLAIEIVGYSTQGRGIKAYRFGAGPVRFALIGGLHGGYEWNTILLAYEMIDYLHAHPEDVPTPLTVYVIPSANPDGQFLVTGKEGRFSPGDVDADATPGRFNARGMDLNRNWDCEWSPVGVWQSRPVSGGSRPFSEVETRALRSFLISRRVQAVLFWHSALPGVFAGGCPEPLPLAQTLASEYAEASGYSYLSAFPSYPVTGDAADWLSLVGIPAIEVELAYHTRTEFDRNLDGVLAVFERLETIGPEARDSSSQRFAYASPVIGAVPLRHGSPLPR